jgi:hypothetical protein
MCMYINTSCTHQACWADLELYKLANELMDKQAAACRLWALKLPGRRSNSVNWEHNSWTSRLRRADYEPFNGAVIQQSENTGSACISLFCSLPPATTSGRIWRLGLYTFFCFSLFPLLINSWGTQKESSSASVLFFYFLIFHFFGSSKPRDLRKIRS